MPPEFYFAIGGRPQYDDCAIALAVGQDAFLVPGCSAAAAYLAALPATRVRVALDSHILDPQRPSLERYAEAVAAWHTRPDRFAFALSYDYLGDPARSERAYDALCARLAQLGVTTIDSLVPVVQRGGDLADTLGLPPAPEDIPLDELLLPRHATPALAFGGVAFAQYGPTAYSWLVGQLYALEHYPTSAAHLLGLAHPRVVRRAVVASFDSSRPARQALAGWPAIAPHYQIRYGFAPHELQASRAVRLAYWIIDTRDRVGLPWTPVGLHDLPDDRRAPQPWYQRDYTGNDAT